MKSTQAFTVIEIANKLGIIKLIKNLQKASSSLNREKTKIFNKIKLEYMEELKNDPDRFSEIVENHELADKLYEINDEIDALNLDLIEGIVRDIPKAKDEIFSFVADFKGISVEDVESDIGVVINTIKEVISDPNLQNLFKSLKM